MDLREKAYRLKQEGYSYAAIARKLGISKSTAYKYAMSHPEQEANSDLFEDETTSLEVKNVESVIEEINSRIISVEEVKEINRAIEREEKVEPKEKPHEKVIRKAGGKFNILLIAVAAIFVVIAVYYVFFKKDNGAEEKKSPSDEEMADQIKKKKSEIKESERGYESMEEWLKRAGIEGALM